MLGIPRFQGARRPGYQAKAAAPRARRNSCRPGVTNADASFVVRVFNDILELQETQGVHDAFLGEGLHRLLLSRCALCCPVLSQLERDLPDGTLSLLRAMTASGRSFL